MRAYAWRIKHFRTAPAYASIDRTAVSVAGWSRFFKVKVKFVFRFAVVVDFAVVVVTGRSTERARSLALLFSMVVCAVAAQRSIHFAPHEISARAHVSINRFYRQSVSLPNWWQARAFCALCDAIRLCGRRGRNRRRQACIVARNVWHRFRMCTIHMYVHFSFFFGYSNCCLA